MPPDRAHNSPSMPYGRARSCLVSLHLTSVAWGAGAVLLISLMAVACSGSERPSQRSEMMEHFNSGVQLSKEGQWEEAVAEFDKAIELDPSYALAYYNRGRAHAELGNASQAIADYEKTIELEPSWSDALEEDIDELQDE
jgi:tetratricopeptide (TPR) repeat protein